MSFSKPVSGELQVYGNRIFDNAALPNTTSKLSDAFSCQGSALGLEIVCTAVTALSVPATKEFHVELWHSDSKDGTYAKYGELFELKGGASAAATAAINSELFRFVPSSGVKHFQKLKLIADADLSAAKLEAHFVRKAH